MSERVYRRRLPHIQPGVEYLFVTYRLLESLPIEVVRRLELEYRREVEEIRRIVPGESDQRAYRRIAEGKKFMKWDHCLDTAGTKEVDLSEPWTAALVKQALLFYHPKHYQLVCFTVMPNHVHLICQVDSNGTRLSKVIANQKRYIANQYNKKMNRRGGLWQHEYYDHRVRDGRLDDTISYVLNNPVKAGWVSHWQDWPHTWLHPNFSEDWCR